MLAIRAGIPKMLVRIANRKDPDEIAPSEAVWSGSAAAICQSLFDRQLVSKILEHLPLYSMSCTTSWSYYLPSFSIIFCVLKVANVVFKP